MQNTFDLFAWSELNILVARLKIQGQNDRYRSQETQLKQLLHPIESLALILYRTELL